MDNETYNIVIKDLVDSALAIEQSKRPAYTIGNKDVLYNFKSVAWRLGVSPMQAWGVYALKHFDSIMALAKDPNIPQAEHIKGRFCDALNYLKLGYALYVDQENERQRKNSAN